LLVFVGVGRLGRLGREDALGESNVGAGTTGGGESAGTEEAPLMPFVVGCASPGGASEAATVAACGDVAAAVDRATVLPELVVAGWAVPAEEVEEVDAGNREDEEAGGAEEPFLARSA
jgi:hypothetical protein